MSIWLTPVRSRRLDEILFLTNKHSNEKCQYSYFIEYNHLTPDPWQQLSIFEQSLHKQISDWNANLQVNQIFICTNTFLAEVYIVITCTTYSSNLCSLGIPLLLTASFGNLYQHYFEERVNVKVRMTVTVIDISYRIQNMERNFRSCNYTLPRVLIMAWQWNSHFFFFVRTRSLHFGCTVVVFKCWL